MSPFGGARVWDTKRGEGIIDGGGRFGQWRGHEAPLVNHSNPSYPYILPDYCDQNELARGFPLYRKDLFSALSILFSGQMNCIKI